MWLGHDGMAVHLTQHHKQKEYLVQKLTILNVRLDKTVSAT
jgi:hypothetical protein